MRARRRSPLQAPDFDTLYEAGDERRLSPTPAEAGLERILNALGDGALRGEFKREWPIEGWYLDFYFPSLKLAIEVDGGYHRAQAQWREDQLKNAALEKQGITLLRLINAEVFGERDRLVEKLRAAWRLALQAQREQGKTAREPLAAYWVELVGEEPGSEAAPSVAPAPQAHPGT